MDWMMAAYRTTRRELGMADGSLYARQQAVLQDRAHTRNSA